MALTNKRRHEILTSVYGGTDLRTILADLKPDDFPGRIAIPACVIADFKSKDDLLLFCEMLYEGASTGFDAYVETPGEEIAFNDDRLYLGWKEERASYEDVAPSYEEDQAS